MHATIRTWGVCAGVAWASIALAAPSPNAPRPSTPKPSQAKPAAPKPAAPKPDAGEKYKRALQEEQNGDPEAALATIEESLAIAPGDRRLLSLKGTVLLELRDYAGALAAYQAYLATGVTGANRREALKIIRDIGTAQSTFLDITVANGPAEIYLGSKAQGAFCTAAPVCHKSIVPGEYKVIIDRPGFDRWIRRVTIENGKPGKLDATLTEKPSLLTVRVAQPGARVTVDDAPYDAPAAVAAGSHRVVVSLAGHVEARLEAAAHEGKPVELDIALTPLVPVRVEPSGATLLLDGKPVVLRENGIEIAPGAHTLVARAQGFQDRRVDIPAEYPPDYKIAVELAPVPPLAAVAGTTPGRFTLKRKIALGVGGVGVVAAASGVVLGLQSRQLDHDTYALCPSPSTPCSEALEANDLNQRGQARARQANIAFGVTGAATVAAAILWLTGAPESRVAVTPHLGAVAGLDLAVRF